MKILVIATDLVLIQSLSDWLASIGYTVDTASDSDSGWHYATALAYDLIVIDSEALLQGDALPDQLQTQGIHSPVVVLHPATDELEGAIAPSVNVQAYLKKPVDFDELFNQIQTLRPARSTQSHLQAALAELHRTKAALREKTEALAIAQTALEQERRQRQASDYKLSNILNQAIAAISSFRVSANKDWEYEYWSAGCECLFTYSLTELQSSKEFWLSRVLPEDREKALMPLFEAFFTERDATAEYRFQCKDGSIRWFLSTYASRKIGTDCWLVTAVNADITAYKQTERSLQETTTALLNAVEGISRLDTEGRYIFVNDAYAQMLGCTPADLIGTTWQPTVHPEDSAKLEAAYQEMRIQGKVELEARGLRRDGTPFYKQVVMVAVYDEQQQLAGHYCFMKNISKRKQLEAERQHATAELKQSEQKIRALFNSTFQYMGLLKPDGMVIEANQAFLAVIDADLADVIGKPFWETRWWTHFPEQRQQIKDAIARAAKGEFIRFESKHLWAKGTLAFVDFSIKPIRDGEGAVVMLLPEGRDITERKLSEQALRESETRYRLLFNNTPNPIWVFDPETLKFLAVNPAAVEHYGYSEAEFLSMTIADIRPPEDCILLHQDLARARSQQKYTGVWRHLKKDGSLIDVEILAHAFKFEGKPASLVLVTDITERLKAERKIREQAALIDITTDAILVQNLENRILFWSKSAERLYGWTESEALAQDADVLFAFDAQTTLKTGLQAVLTHGTWQGELQQQTKTGKPITVASRWTVVKDELDNPHSILVVNTDVTEKKKLEAQFYRAQRLESLGTLASGIAHDLNNVLTPVLAISQLMRMTQPNLDDQGVQLLEVLESSAKRGANMVKQIVTFAHGTEGKRVTLQVAHLLQEIITVAQQTFPKSIAIQQDIPAHHLWLVSADPTHLHQVFMNLCVNARDAMPHGGVLTVSAENDIVDERFAQQNLDAKVGSYIRVTVADTGIGIPEEVRDRIFEPFFTTKQAELGTGLGLSTALGIVKNYGGFLQVTSEVGQGTRFKVYLPTAMDDVAEPSSDEDMLYGQGELVLIVDDDLGVQRANQSLLEAYHYRTLLANDGVQAIALYETHQQDIQVILIDVMMPNMDGVSTVRTLKQMNPGAKIIAVSGILSTRASILAAGAAQFLTKPYSIDDLLLAVHCLLNDDVA